MTVSIPLTQTPSQVVSVNLNGQNCVISVYTKGQNTFCDLVSGGVTLLTTVLCHDRDRIVRYSYLGFSGDLSFVDVQGRTDPYYTGFGTRYFLAYFTPDEVAEFTA